MNIRLPQEGLHHGGGYLGKFNLDATNIYK